MNDYVVIAGNDVHEKYKTLIQGCKTNFDVYIKFGDLGFVEAEIFKNRFGFSIRHSSLLQYFSNIYQAKEGDTLGYAIEKAHEWQRQAPTKRFVTCLKEHLHE